MRLYSVHAPLEDSALENTAFVKDGFSWPALFVPILFILWHRLWLTLVWYVVFVLVVAWTGRLGGDGLAFAIAALGTLLFALEANNIRRLSLENLGWREVGATFGSGLDEAEARFFAMSESEAAASRKESAGAPYAPLTGDSGTEEPIIGLFPEPER